MRMGHPVRIDYRPERAIAGPLPATVNTQLVIEYSFSLHRDESSRLVRHEVHFKVIRLWVVPERSVVKRRASIFLAWQLTAGLVPICVSQVAMKRHNAVR